MGTSLLREVQLACYDFDGHLANTEESLERYHFELYMNVVGKAPPLQFERKVRKLVGGPGLKVMAALWPKVGEEGHKYLLEEFRRIAAQDRHPSREMPGVPEHLARLATDLRQVIITNRTVNLPEAFAGANIDSAWIAALYLPKGAAVPEIPGLRVYYFSTKADAITHARGVTPKHHCSMSGDAKPDIEQGRNAGVITVAVPHRVASARELRQASPDYLLSSFEALAYKLRPV